MARNLKEEIHRRQDTPCKGQEAQRDRWGAAVHKPRGAEDPPAPKPGRGLKSRLLLANVCNVYVPKQKKIVKTKVLTVKANPSNPNYVQRNIITKSAVVGTELGDVLITSRPGQDGALNGVLIGK